MASERLPRFSNAKFAQPRGARRARKRFQVVRCEARRIQPENLQRRELVLHQAREPAALKRGGTQVERTELGEPAEPDRGGGVEVQIAELQFFKRIEVRRTEQRVCVRACHHVPTDLKAL